MVVTLPVSLEWCAVEATSSMTPCASAATASLTSATEITSVFTTGGSDTAHVNPEMKPHVSECVYRGWV